MTNRVTAKQTPVGQVSILKPYYDSSKNGDHDTKYINVGRLGYNAM
jgi:hypothetical protein